MTDMVQILSRGNLFKEFAEQTLWEPFDYYMAQIKVGELAGGIPKNKDLIKAWVWAKNKEKSEEVLKSIYQATLEELGDKTDEVAEKGWTTFKYDERGLYIEGRQLKAMMKESANIIKKIAPGASNKPKKETEVEEVTGITNLKSKIADHTFVMNERVHLGKTQDDIFMVEQAIHVMTPQGERSSIKRTDHVRNVELSFVIKILRKSEITKATLMAILHYSQSIGLGADRSQGLGVFEVKTVVKLEGPDEAKDLVALQ